MLRRALALAALGLAGCGGSAPRVPTDEAVIRRWADELRAGHVAQAVEQFRLPVLVANGGPGALLRTRAQIELFNRSLPCGARLLSTRHDSGRVVATFVLTERVGGAGCGKGTGHQASVAFRIKGHRIVEWLRVETPGDGASPGTEV